MSFETLKKIVLMMLMIVGTTEVDAQKQWTLQECIDYAMANNITLQKSGLQRQSAVEDMLQSKAQLLPSLSASTNQNVTYQPWPESGSFSVQGSKVQTRVDKTFYNGSYSVAANWTVWNGNRNRNQVKLNRMTAEKNAVDSATTARSIEEQITQLYVQILYTEENVKVQRQTLDVAVANENRGKELVKVGKMSRADLAQLTSQRAQDEYNVVAAESNVRNYKRQLKQLLQLTDDGEFNVSPVEATDAMAMAVIPSLRSVYDEAVAKRPELRSAQMAIESSMVQKSVAKAQNMPTVSLSASVGTNTTSMNNNTWGTQLKNNMSVGGGVSVSVPLIDQRQKKTAVNKAEIAYQQALLDLRDKETTLYSTIENYWIQADNNQHQYKAAKIGTESARTSYELLSEQFAVGLKNIVELQEGKTRLLTAEQNELQSKYMTIYNLKMLEFYRK